MPRPADAASPPLLQVHVNTGLSRRPIATHNISMIGPPGSGKTLLAKHLAEAVQCRSLDRTYWC
ncbi:MAG: ATP-binding protein [Bryobacteraceae bacterium]